MSGILWVPYVSFTDHVALILSQAANTVELVTVATHPVQDVLWFDDDDFLAVGYFDVIKMDITGNQMGEYSFGNYPIQSAGIERTNNYLILITYVIKSNEHFDFVYSGRSEKRILIYDMAKEETLYQVPFLEEILNAHPIPGTVDILITQMDQKVFQLWSLDIENRDSDTRSPRTDMLKKRTVTPHNNVDPEDYIGFTCVAGNRNQFIFNMAASGNIDISLRESGMPYLRFQSPILREKGEGVHCFSWRRSDDKIATFVTVGIQRHTLRVWRCEQLPRPKSQTCPESLNHLTTNENSGNSDSQPAENMAVAPSSTSLEPGGIGQPEEIPAEDSAKVDRQAEEAPTVEDNVVDPPNGPEVGPSTSNS